MEKIKPEHLAGNFFRGFLFVICLQLYFLNILHLGYGGKKTKFKQAGLNIL